MTSDELITDLIGKGWDEAVLPLLLNEIKKAFDDANRYYFLRDFAKTLTFNDNPRDRLELKMFDDALDAKQHDLTENH